MYISFETDMVDRLTDRQDSPWQKKAATVLITTKTLIHTFHIIHAANSRHTKSRQCKFSQHRTWRSYTENIRGLNLSAVRHTTVQVTKL